MAKWIHADLICKHPLGFGSINGRASVLLLPLGRACIARQGGLGLSLSVFAVLPLAPAEPNLAMRPARAPRDRALPLRLPGAERATGVLSQLAN